MALIPFSSGDRQGRGALVDAKMATSTELAALRNQCHEYARTRALDLAGSGSCVGAEQAGQEIPGGWFLLSEAPAGRAARGW